MPAPTTGTLEVRGARLYYELRGAGPSVVLVPGGSGDAALYEPLANLMAPRYTVLTYDRRGFGRSPLDAPPDDELVTANADDVVELIDRVLGGRAHVFASSAGAIIALVALTRDDQRLTTVVAHEPPLVTLLPDAATHLQFVDDVYATFTREGAERAIPQLMAGLGAGNLPGPPAGVVLPPAVVETMARVRRNMEFSLAHEVRQYPRVELDLAALQLRAARLVLAGGQESRAGFPYRPNVVIGERLGLTVVDFPGNHIGYMTKPGAFAAQLPALLDPAR
jgi:pimeloyl-ACP methyl ester carboxylesterase